MKRKDPNDPQQTLLFADVVRNGDGFTIIPRKPLQEIGSTQAAEMLQCAKSTLIYILNTRKGQKYLRWRWLTEKKGKRVFELESVIAYREASKDSEFGD